MWEELPDCLAFFSLYQNKEQKERIRYSQTMELKLS